MKKCKKICIIKLWQWEDSNPDLWETICLQFEGQYFVHHFTSFEGKMDLTIQDQKGEKYVFRVSVKKI